jgi:hypothetical protein
MLQAKASSIFVMLIISRFVIPVLVPEVMVSTMMVLAVLLGISSTMMTGESIAIVNTSLAVVVGARAAVVVAGACYSRG